MHKVVRVTRSVILIISLYLGLLTGCSKFSPIETRTSAVNVKQALNSVADSVWQQALESNANLRLRVGLPVVEIPDITYKATTEDIDFAEQALIQLMTIPTEKLTHEDWLTWDMVRNYLQFKIEKFDYYWLQFPVTPYNGSGLLGTLQKIVKTAAVGTSAQRDIYFGLINEYAKILNQMTDKLEGQVSRGVLIPKPAIPGIKGMFSAYRDNTMDTFSIAEHRLTDLNNKTKTQFVTQVEQVVHAQVIPAFNRLIDYLGPDYQQRAPEAVGLYQYPQGKQYYRHLVKYYTLPNETPKSLFEYGQQRVKEIATQMQKIRQDLGFKGTPAEFHQLLRTDPRFLAKNPSEVEQRYNHYIRRIEPLIKDYFLVKPKTPYGVKRLDFSQEAGMTFGYYQSPTLSSPMGFYRYNGSALDQRSLISAGHLIYHELIPGHHFQFGLQQENKKIPIIRRELLGATGFSEGWAEYAANLANEMGLLDDPYDQYGHLLFEMFLTVRLVVDPGMNYFGWSLQQARDYMKQHIFQSDLQIASESLRYSTDLPGQALSYKIGHRTIMGLRSKAENKLDNRFDIRSFHSELLKHGALGLDTLEKHISLYLTRHR